MQNIQKESETKTKTIDKTQKKIEKAEDPKPKAVLPKIEIIETLEKLMPNFDNIDNGINEKTVLCLNLDRP